MTLEWLEHTIRASEQIGIEQERRVIAVVRRVSQE